MRLLISFIVLATLSTPAMAERFLGLMPGDRLTSIKSKYPNAAYEELKPAWLQPYQRLIQIAGSGIDGVVAVKLSHEADSMAAALKELAVKQANRIELTRLEQRALETWPDRLARLREKPPDDPWELKDVRWEPSVPVALKQTLVRYGKPERDEIDEQFRRVVEWKRRGITAYVSASETVTLFIYEFSFGDQLCKSLWEKNEPCDAMNPMASFPKLPEEKPTRPTPPKRVTPGSTKQ